MKTIEETIEVIKERIGWHEKELSATLGPNQELMEKITEMKKTGGQRKELVIQSGKLMVLNNRITFHKSCKLALEELLKDISG